MGRSPGFAFAAPYCGALFRLAFATDPGVRHPYPRMGRATRWLIKQKARRHPFRRTGSDRL